MEKEDRERSTERRTDEGKKKKGESEERKKERREGVNEFGGWFCTRGTL